jgi:hypothetical protein
MDIGRAYAKAAEFRVLDVVGRWLAGHHTAAELDAAGSFLQGYWQEVDDWHDGLVAHFLEHAEANPPEALTRDLQNRLVFILAHGLRRTASPEIKRRALAALSRLDEAADRVHLGWGARRVLAELQGDGLQ